VTVWRLGELDVLVADNLDAVAPRVEKVEKRPWQRFDPDVSQRLADGIPVVDHKPKMTSIVSRLSSAFLQCEELVAEIDKSRSAALAANLEVKQLTVKGGSLLDITDFQRYVVQTNGAHLLSFGHDGRLADEKWCGSDLGAVVDLPDDEVRDVSAADNPEPPLVWRNQNAVVPSRWPVCQ